MGRGHQLCPGLGYQAKRPVVPTRKVWRSRQTIEQQDQEHSNRPQTQKEYEIAQEELEIKREEKDHQQVHNTPAMATLEEVPISEQVWRVKEMFASYEVLVPFR